MFTGIVREVGLVRTLERSAGGTQVRIDAPQSTRTLERGGSISVDGVCLTATTVENGAFTADIVPETMERTIWGERKAGMRVNLELPMRLGDPLDGHLVQGHVDGVGVVQTVTPLENQRMVEIDPPEDLLPFIAAKGSIAVNGVSLTVASVKSGTFSVALIPTTLEETNLKELKPGSRVNLEVDLLARYAARLLEARR
ncbi:MAG TPA: riboflavin synthase [bacterium]|nr:riboflavin synthase [bacterium]